MSIQLQRISGAPQAQTAHIRTQEFVADGSEQEGGADSGPSTHDLYDAALGAYKALTVLWFARKKGLPVQDLQTVVERDASTERAVTYRPPTRLQVSGELTDAHIGELPAVAYKCPVHKLTTSVTTEFEPLVERAV
ncbi:MULTISPECIES: OsmC family protein [unclassified Acidovorax]|uniref:OsmC family protein n=1 Tax=unclassified Acidovorax TaxID=2684926 RepID=UPI000C1A4593|nr:MULTISPECIES: OsmC family protein [unclassified Acidovorax]PIF16787.1 putative redox protein [Acidovorax sp. 59]PKW04188.1 putative redox protein [Acidovorax sp. 30]